MFTDLAKKGDEDQKVVFRLLLYVIDWPTGRASKTLNIDSDNVAGLAHQYNVHGFLISEGKAGVTSQPVKHRENVKL